MPTAHRAGRPRVNRRSPGRARCRYCSRALTTLGHYSGDCCSTPRCRERHLQDQLETFRKDTARLVETPEPERYAIVVIPHRPGELVPVEPDRLRALEDHLSTLAAGCTGQPAVSVHSHDSLLAVPAVCSSCQGACCYRGGNHAAFLDEDTIGHSRRCTHA